MSVRQFRAETAAALAPTAPPCFSSRDQWIEYVSTCAVDQRDGHAPGPLLLEPGKPARFNPKFSICQDCDNRYAKQMAIYGRCKPRYLIELFAVTVAVIAKEIA